MSRLRILLLVLFLLSGAAGLIHELAWTRVLRHLLGGSSLALISVLAAFLGGLALGAHLAARALPRLRSPLFAFAALEALIAVWTLLLPWIVQGSWPLWRALYADGPGAAFTAARLVGALLLLAPAAIAMGASLPLLAELGGGRSGDGRWVGWLYGVNALGAAGGVLLAGFVLLPDFGLTLTIRVAAGANAVAAVVAFVLSRGRVPVSPAAVTRVAAAPARALTLAYLFASIALLVHEIAWARVATLLLGSTTYAFSLLLAVIVAGLAIGGLLATRFVATVAVALRTFLVTQGLAAAIAFAIIVGIPQLPFAITRWYATAESGSALGVTAALLVALFAAPALLMGFAYPLVCRIVDGADSVGRSAGKMQALGNVGALLGVLLAGLLLLPWLGLRGTLIVGVTLNLLAVFVPFAVQPRSRFAACFALSVGLIAMISLPHWDPARLSLGPFVQARRQPHEVAVSAAALEQLERAQRVLFHRDGREASVTVKETPDGERSLWINGKPDASSFSDLATQRLLAHLPLLLHPDPRRVLLIGLGSGVTLRSAATHAVERIDTVEISDQAVELARWFAQVNHSVLDDPRVHLIVADGRLHTTLTQARYDVIVSEPSNPWIAGIGDLYTREFFTRVAARLEPRGIFCLWVPAYHLDLPSFRSVVATYVAQFPNSGLWHTQGSDYLLIGSREALDVDAAQLAARLATGATHDELSALQVERPADLLANLVVETPELRTWADGARTHTDDNALLEFEAPKRLLRNTQELQLLRTIESARHAGFAFLSGTQADATIAQAQQFHRARGAAIRANLALGQGDTESGLAGLREAARLNLQDPFLESTLAANQRHAEQRVAAGELREALARYEMLVGIAPEREASRRGLAELRQRLAATP